MPTAVAMSSADVAGFLLRHPVIAARVAEFNTLVAISGYDGQKWQPAGVLEWDVTVPGWIPQQGLEIADSSLDYPYVTIFPDASGTLQYRNTDLLIQDVFNELTDAGGSSDQTGLTGLLNGIADAANLSDTTLTTVQHLALIALGLVGLYIGFEVWETLKTA